MGMEDLIGLVAVRGKRQMHEETFPTDPQLFRDAVAGGGHVV